MVLFCDPKVGIPKIWVGVVFCMRAGRCRKKATHTVACPWRQPRLPRPPVTSSAATSFGAVPAWSHPRGQRHLRPSRGLVRGNDPHFHFAPPPPWRSRRRRAGSSEAERGVSGPRLVRVSVRDEIVLATALWPREPDGLPIMVSDATPPVMSPQVQAREAGWELEVGSWERNKDTEQRTED